MKRKLIIAAVIAAVMALGVVTVFALDYDVPEDAISVTARFSFVGSDNYEGDEISMIIEGGEMIIHITDDTLIYFEDFVPLGDEEDDGMTQMVREVLFGRTLAEVLDGRNMRVIYQESEHIEPISIMILFETPVTGPEPIDLGDFEDLTVEDVPSVAVEWEDVAPDPPESSQFNISGEIVVNNVLLEQSAIMFLNEGVVVIMVPLRAVTDALGYDITWNHSLRSVQIGAAIHIRIGSTEAEIGRMSPIELSAAPIIEDGATFVPLDFFSSVLGREAYVSAGQVIIEQESD